jgi:hypothetical protein
MIVEAILIGQLLKKLSLQSTPKIVGPPVSKPDVIKKFQKPPDAPTPIRPPSGYQVDLDLIRYFK